MREGDCSRPDLGDYPEMKEYRFERELTDKEAKLLLFTIGNKRGAKAMLKGTQVVGCIADEQDIKDFIELTGYPEEKIQE